MTNEKKIREALLQARIQINAGLLDSADKFIALAMSALAAPAPQEERKEQCPSCDGLLDTAGCTCPAPPAREDVTALRHALGEVVRSREIAWNALDEIAAPDNKTSEQRRKIAAAARDASAESTIHAATPASEPDYADVLPRTAKRMQRMMKDAASAPEATIVPAAGPPVRQKYEVTGRRADNMPELRRIASEETFNLLGPLASCHVPESAPEAKETIRYCRVCGASECGHDGYDGHAFAPAPAPRCECGHAERMHTMDHKACRVALCRCLAWNPACQGRK